MLWILCGKREEEYYKKCEQKYKQDIKEGNYNKRLMIAATYFIFLLNSSFVSIIVIRKHEFCILSSLLVKMKQHLSLRSHHRKYIPKMF
jgi:hypothetical protein